MAGDYKRTIQCGSGLIYKRCIFNLVVDGNSICTIQNNLPAPLEKRPCNQHFIRWSKDAFLIQNSYSKFLFGDISNPDLKSNNNYFLVNKTNIWLMDKCGVSLLLYNLYQNKLLLCNITFKSLVAT